LALNQLIANWRPGGGFLEPGTKFVNVRSIFNPCIAIKSYLSAVSLQRDNSPRVFIVHGRNLELTDRVELFLRRIGCDCIELRFEPAGSKTIQEKFNDIADSAFDCVVVLMTADDKGSLKKQKRTKNRARQNVVLELGYFLSQLGNEHVFILAHKSVETPSDLHGAQIIYIERNFNNTLAKLGNEIQCIRGIQPRKISAALQA
jgi:predicted nucleotide-binding protein